jgi:3-deoxy-D-manno-octulosonate 8-phosphate phosphatase (KDO 8-P phosphatase)
MATPGFLNSPGSPDEAISRARAIKLVALDIDGTLTDGSIVFGPQGELAKRFDVRDGFGLTLLKAAGIQRVIITGRSSAIVNQRVSDLGLEAVYQGVKDKAQQLSAVAQQAGLTLAQCAMVGDDWPDASAMQIAGLAAAPADAAPEIRQLAHWVSGEKAGLGAVREFCEWLLEAQGKLAGLRAQYGLPGNEG